jgi:hypothetical protein
MHNFHARLRSVFSFRSFLQNSFFEFLKKWTKRNTGKNAKCHEVWPHFAGIREGSKGGPCPPLANDLARKV